MKHSITKHAGKLVLTVCLLASLQEARAQLWLGTANSNYAGTNGVYMNPSSIADSRYRYFINFWGRGVNFYNNYLSYNAPFKLNQWANGTYNKTDYDNLNGRPDFKQDWLTEDLNGKDKQFSFTQELRGPAIMFPMGKNAAWSINTRQRTAMQIFGMSEPLARIARYGIDSGHIYSGIGAVQTGVAYNNKGFSAAIENYQEISATLAGTMVNEGRHFLKGGATFKVLRGMGAAYLNSKGNLTVNNYDSVTLTNTDLRYAHTDRASLFDPVNHPYDIFSNKTTGNGVGIDLGFTYEYRPERGKYVNTRRWCDENQRHSDYQWKLGASVMDLGVIKHWRTAQKYTSNFTGPEGINVNPAMLDAFRNAGDGFQGFDSSLVGVLPHEASNGFTTTLPAALNVNFDYRITKNFYLGANWIQNLKGRNAIGTRQTSMVSVLPRIESKGFEFAMPVTLSENYKNVSVGLYTRIGPVFFGSDNFGGLIGVASNNSVRGADIYGGVAFGIGHCRWNSRYTRENKVDPVYKKDTLTKIVRDTIKIVERDTVIKRDTVEKIVNNKTLKEKEAALKKQEEELKKKEAEINKREAEVARKEKNPVTPSSDELKKCKDNVIVLTAELDKERNKNTENERRIAELGRQNEDLKRSKALVEAELANCRKGSTPNDEIIRNRTRITELQKELDEAKRQRDLVLVDYENCKKNTTNNLDLENTKTRLKDAEAKILKLEADKKACEDERNKITVTLAEKTNRVTQLEKDLADLKQKQLVCQTDLDNCRKGTAGNDEVLKISEQLKKEQEEKGRIKAELDETKNKVVVLTAENETLKKQNTTLTADLEKEKAANKACQDSKTQMIEEIKFYAAELDKCKKAQQNTADVVKVQEELTKTKTDLEAEKNKNTVLATENESLKKQNVTLSADLENCRKNAGNQEELNKTKTELSEVKNKVTVLSSENESLKKQNTTLAADLENCKKNQNTSGGAVQDELDKTKAELTDVKNKNTVLVTENTTLKQQNETLTADLNKAKTDNQNCQNQKNQALEEVKFYSAELEKCKKAQQGAGSQDELNKVKADLDQQKADNKSLSDENSKLKADLSSVNNRISSLESDLNAARQQLSRCQSDLDNCQKNQVSADELARVKADLDKAKTDNQNCQNQKTQAQEEMKFYSSELQKAKASVADLQKQIGDLNAQKAQIQGQLDECQKAKPESPGDH